MGQHADITFFSGSNEATGRLGKEADGGAI